MQKNHNYLNVNNPSPKFGVRVYCLGEAMSDTFISVEGAEIKSGKKRLLCLPYGEKLNVTEMKHKGGGSAFNVAVGLRRLGLDSSLIVSIGQDSEGARLKSAIKKEAIREENVIDSADFETKSAIILNGEDGDRTIFVYHGRGVMDKNMIDWDSISIGSWFYLGPMPETARDLLNYLLEVVVKKNLKLMVNPGCVQLEWGKDYNQKIISAAKLYVLNKEEAEEIMGSATDEKELLSNFIKTGAKNIIITDGANGSFGSDGSNYYHLDILKVSTLDMTGAGDGYLVGAVGALISGLSLKEAMVWGAINGAAVVEKLGAQEGLLTFEEIKRKTETAGLKVEEL